MLLTKSKQNNQICAKQNIFQKLVWDRCLTLAQKFVAQVWGPSNSVKCAQTGAPAFELPTLAVLKILKFVEGVILPKWPNEALLFEPNLDFIICLLFIKIFKLNR